VRTVLKTVAKGNESRWRVGRHYGREKARARQISLVSLVDFVSQISLVSLLDSLTGREELGKTYNPRDK